MTAQVQPQTSIRLRGRSLLAFVLAPEAPLDDWTGELDTWLKRSPGFFAGRPVLLDVAGLKLDRESLAKLLADLRERDIRIMGVEGANSAWLKLGMPPPVERDRQQGMAEVLEGAMSKGNAKGNGSSAPLVVDGPVRSGRSIVHAGGDVVVTGSVASGAEVIAGGSIHIYGALRGRAIAGSAGNESARIYCNALEAEFFGIDGIYRTADEMDPKFRGQRVQIRLDKDQLKMVPLSGNRQGR